MSCRSGTDFFTHSTEANQNDYRQRLASVENQLKELNANPGSGNRWSPRIITAMKYWYCARTNEELASKLALKGRSGSEHSETN